VRIRLVQSPAAARRPVTFRRRLSRCRILRHVNRIGLVCTFAIAALLAACGDGPSATAAASPEPPQIEVVVTNASRTPTAVQIRVSLDLALARSTAGPCDAVAVRSRTPGTWEVLVAEETVLSSDAAGLPSPAVGEALRVVIRVSADGTAHVDQTNIVALGDFISGGATLDPFRPDPTDCAS